MRSGVRILLLAAAAALCFTLAGCEKKNDSGGQESSSSSAPDSSANPSTVSVKKYTFPEFMRSQKEPDMLSREVYKSFDKDSAETAVKEQPFKDYQCKKSIGGMFYTYSEGEYVGLIDSAGNVVIKADKIYDITAVSGDLIACYSDKEHKKPSDYYYVTSSGMAVKADSSTTGFRANAITVNAHTEQAPGTPEPVQRFTLDIDPRAVRTPTVEYPAGNSLWDTLEKCEPQAINTAKSYRAYYKATRSGASYYICFDEYYNYYVYEASYAKIRMKIGSDIGECYVQSFDDYTELSKMVKSFGKAGSTVMPDSNEGLDYVQITFGINSADQYVMTMSSDGWCFVDNLTHVNQPDNKFFACYDKDSFVSLVQWVDQVVSKEYAAKK